MKVHIALNSHLDPVWLWNKEQGMDEVVATARTACDLLDDYPEIFMTRGEAWFYETLELCAPAIYDRVKKHVASGRLDAADFPLLLHTDEILTEKKPVNIPWESFTFERA